MEGLNFRILLKNYKIFPTFQFFEIPKHLSHIIVLGILLIQKIKSGYRLVNQGVLIMCLCCGGVCGEWVGGLHQGL